MLVPLSWLNKYIEESDVNKIETILLQAGLEVEEVLLHESGDEILKVEVTPNRGDWASIIGVARELSAIGGYDLKKRVVEPNLDSNLNTEDHIKLNLKEPKLCRKYQATLIEGLSVENSNEIIASSLEKMREKTINNVVDATNFAMFELGQPLHAFDGDKIEGEIIIRTAKEGEEIELINGKLVKLDIKDLIIADSKRPIALAGVMGGRETEVTKKTKRIILESAWFEPKTIRATSKRHSISTEASYRFERMVDPNITSKASKLVIEILKEGQPTIKVAKPVMEKGSSFRKNKVRLETNKINQILGLDLKEQDILTMLDNLGFKIERNKVTTPSWRSDIRIVEDLVEEVARSYGYDKLPEKSLKKKESNLSDSNWYQVEQLKDYLAKKDFLEVYNYSFISPEDAQVFNLPVKNLLEVVNPVDPDNKYMRASLFPGLVKTIAKNQQESQIKAFEIGQVFNKKSVTRKEANLKLGLVAFGVEEAELTQITKELEKNLKIKAENRYLHRDDKKDQQVFKKYKIRKPSIHIVEFDLNRANFDWLDKKIELPPKKGFSFQEVSKYPEVNRDLAFIVSRDIKSDEVKKLILSADELIVRVELFDEFEHDRFGKNKKNLAYHIFFQAPDRTLKDKEVDKLVERTISLVEKKFEAKLRE